MPRDTGNEHTEQLERGRNYTYLSRGPQGSGHGRGLTHISVPSGKTILIDPVASSYREDEPLRMEFKMLQGPINKCSV